MFECEPKILIVEPLDVSAKIDLSLVLHLLSSAAELFRKKRKEKQKESLNLLFPPAAHTVHTITVNGVRQSPLCSALPSSGEKICFTLRC